MSEQSTEQPPTDALRLRNTEAILLALGETRAAAQQAAATAARVEQSVGSLAQRVGALEVDVAGMKAQLSARDKADEAHRAEETTKTPPATWIALVVAVAAVLVPLLLDAYHS